AIRCTHPTCHCECFAPGKQSLRYCDTCNHGWVAHALDKLGTNHVMNLGLQVEVVQPNIVFDIASLMLYGAQATPVRLKILLDRLFSVLQHDEVLQVLHGFGWTYEDYARGYILQDSSGRVLDKWCVATREEEMVVLQQFLRFGETKAIAQEIILQDTKDRHEQLVKQTPRAESDIKKFIERSNLTMQNYIKSYESTRQLFGTRSVPFIPPNRIITSPVISPNFSPGREPRGLPLAQTPTTSSLPLTSPLTRLPVIQPFEAHKELPSPAISVSPIGLEKHVAHQSPVCESPKNLSINTTVITTASTQPTHPVLIQQQHHHCLDEVDGADLYPSESEDEGEALDYSNKDNPGSLNDGDKNSKQHMRKSNNPIKRQWTPSANFGSTFVGPNGKKRVLCTACNKTFCDKGALKIHYSAVHLKEMHKCTVEGCNMMFSSRRSRNRHSANPNPKLHMPQKRKDELDQSEEIDLSTSSGSGTPAPSSTPNISIPTPSPVAIIPTQALPILDSPHIIRPDSSFFIEMSAQFPFLSPPEKRIKLEEEQPTDLSKITVTNLPEEEPCDLSKKYDDELKLEIDLDAPVNEKESIRKDEEGDNEDNGFRHEGGFRGGNRRKNTAPTKCAQSGTASDDSSHDKDPNSRIIVYMKQDEVPACNGDSSLQENDVEREHSNILVHRVLEVKSAELQDVACSLALQEKRLEGTEARNFPKIASLLWANGLTSSNISDKVNDDDASHEVDDSFARDEESIQDDEPDIDGDEVSGIESSEDNESLSSTEMQDYPADVYMDSKNPLKCKICGKVFQNSFTVKIHFQNVHLKVMHSCTVDGCSSTFPSKRSRDRHSANLNLHRRILAGDSSANKEVDDTLRGDFLAKLYGHDLITANVISKATANLEDNEHKHINNNNNNNNEEIKNHEGRPFQPMNNGKLSNVSASNSLKITIQHGMLGHVSKPGSTGSEAVSDESEGESEAVRSDEYLKIPCKVCGDKFSNPAVLQEHISISHPEHALSPPDPSMKKMISPRRARSRQKTQSILTARKSTSL
ncbi:unnamed protein product, partial [Candidula unifasciata]